MIGKNNLWSIMTACIEWDKAKDKAGYGVSWLNGKWIRAHRKAYIQNKGEIPDDLVVRHTCDNKACVNPDHLILGDHKQNMADMAAKGRTNTRRGSTHSKAKLTEQQVHEIKSTFGLSQRELAAKYGVSASLIAAIKLGKAWTHVV